MRGIVFSSRFCSISASALLTQPPLSLPAHIWRPRPVLARLQLSVPPLSSRIALIITYAANSFSMKMEIAGLSDKSVNLYTRLYYISRCFATIIFVVMSCVPTHHSVNRIEPIYSSV